MVSALLIFSSSGLFCLSLLPLFSHGVLFNPVALICTSSLVLVYNALFVSAPSLLSSSFQLCLSSSVLLVPAASLLYRCLSALLVFSDILSSAGLQ